MATKQKDPQRTAELAAIHTAKKQLALDDDDYRGYLQEWTGLRSAGDLNQAQRRLVIENLRAMGFTPKRGAPQVQPGDDPQVGKILALWGSLKRAGALRDASARALDQWVERQTGTSALRFTTPGQRVQLIEQLKQWVARVKYARDRKK